MSDNSQQLSEKISVPFPKEHSTSVKGDIKINLAVVAGIVRLAAQLNFYVLFFFSPPDLFYNYIFQSKHFCAIIFHRA